MGQGIALPNCHENALCNINILGDVMRPLIAANWKMHGIMSWASKPGEFEQVFPKAEREDISILICPPTTLIAPMVQGADKASIWLGAQNCHSEASGAHTGEVSAAMLRDVGANFVIVGHSERRAASEMSADVQAKATAVLAEDLTPIICVGESLAERESGKALDVVKKQLVESLPKVIEGELVIAYEPVWAIGTGKIPTIKDIADMHACVRGIVGDKFRILYGGSVKPANAKDVLAVPHVNGALIGGAGLEMESLAAIARAAL